MEFIPRGETRPAAPAAHPAAGRHKRFDWNGRAVRIEWFSFTALAALLLLVAIGWLIYSNLNSGSGEAGRLDKTKYQAVFLNGGATSGSVAYTTYFGHVTNLNSNYMILKDVYYLTTSTATDNTQSANPQLTKLGCQQLHSPEDEMVINRSQVAFWENLQNNGKVVQAIQKFKQQNPGGPNCSASSNSTSTPTNTQTTTPTNPPTTPTPPANRKP